MRGDARMFFDEIARLNWELEMDERDYVQCPVCGRSKKVMLHEGTETEVKCVCGAKFMAVLEPADAAA